MKILTFIGHYLPGYKAGGPTRTIANMADKLDDLQFLIVTSDRDFQENEPYKGVKINEWNDLGKARVFYASHTPLKLVKLFKFYKIVNSTPHDIIYLNSFFDPTSTLLPLMLRRFSSRSFRPVVIAPRGEFSKGALSIKTWKKVPYLFLMRVLNLYSSVTWQASSEFEAHDIRRVIGRSKHKIVNAEDIFVASNITEVSALPNRHRNGTNPADKFKIIFLSRIAKMKNLDFALHILSKVTVPLEFNIYGPVQDESYWMRCRILIDSLPANIKVNYCGSLPTQFVPDTISQHDLFFLPTLGENFGHVIMESLASGTPVLISDRTPWTQDAAGACSAFPLHNERDFVETIERFSRLSNDAKEEISNAAIKLVEEQGSHHQAIQRNIDLFKSAYENKYLS